jgi:hypothetical protein
VRRDLDLFEPKYLLWNIIIGGDDCGEECLPEIPGRTTITMVEVEITAEGERNWKSSAAIELRVRAGESRRSLTTQHVRLSGIVVGEKRKWFVPFTLYHTGCEELEVSAAVIQGGRAVQKPIAKTILFKCGE